MPEIRYECTLHHGEHRLKVNVFTNGRISKDELKPLAISRAVEFLEELGVTADPADVQPIGYKDLGEFI